MALTPSNLAEAFTHRHVLLCASVHGAATHAVRVQNEALVIVNQSRLTECQAFFDGGGVYISRSSRLVAIDANIGRHVADMGGSVFVDTNSHADIRRSVLHGSAAFVAGGAAYVHRLGGMVIHASQLIGTPCDVLGRCAG